jgi:hypothetical protein
LYSALRQLSVTPELENNSPIGMRQRRLLVELLSTVQRVRTLSVSQLLAKVMEAARVAVASPKGRMRPDGGFSEDRLDACVLTLPERPKRGTWCAAAAFAAIHALGFEQTALALVTEWEKRYLQEQQLTATGGSTGRRHDGEGTGSKAARKSKPDGVLGSGLPEVQPGEVVRALVQAGKEIKLKLAPLTGVCLLRFQLKHMSHLLERPSLGVHIDARVQGFVPDPWQRNLLDVVDAGTCSGGLMDGRFDAEAPPDSLACCESEFCSLRCLAPQVPIFAPGRLVCPGGGANLLGQDLHLFICHRQGPAGQHLGTGCHRTAHQGLGQPGSGPGMEAVA